MRLAWIFLAGAIAVLPGTANSGYGFNCAGLLELTEEERQWYLRGYLLALGNAFSEGKSTMGETTYTAGLGRHRDLVEQGIRISDRRSSADALASVAAWLNHLEQGLQKAGRDNVRFEAKLLEECRKPDHAAAGMFEMVPYAMQSMESGGESKWPMRQTVEEAWNKYMH